jgi:hypothetical protein
MRTAATGRRVLISDDFRMVRSAVLSSVGVRSNERAASLLIECLKTLEGCDASVQ